MAESRKMHHIPSFFTYIFCVILCFDRCFFLSFVCFVVKVFNNNVYLSLAELDGDVDETLPPPLCVEDFFGDVEADTSDYAQPDDAT